MAVQAQHPSSIFFFNRNGEEEHDYSLQPQKGRNFFDKSSVPFINRETEISNPRKRGREVATSVNNQSIRVPMNLPPSMQRFLDHSPPQPPSYPVSDGLQLYSGDHPPANFSTNSEEIIAGEIKRQKDELDRFLQTQADELQRRVAAYKEKHYRELISAAEESASRRLREKDAEIKKATRLSCDLQARASQLAAESRLWQAKSAAHETEALSLQAQIQNAVKSRVGTTTETALAAAEAEDAESGFVDPDRVVEVEPGPGPCRVCRRKAATVVAMPCSHLVLCLECDRASRACPVCWALKDSSLEVLLC